MDEDKIVTAIAVILLLTHVAAFIWALRAKEIGAVLGLNLLISACVSVYWLIQISALRGSAVFFQAFVAFEFAVLVTSLLAVFRVPVPRAAIWTEFAVHALLTAAALYFMLTFTMTRMF
jgi:hypothetical protein